MGIHTISPKSENIPHSAGATKVPFFPYKLSSGIYMVTLATVCTISGVSMVTLATVCACTGLQEKYGFA